MRRLEGEDRAAEYRRMGGTNTPKRRNWQQQMRAGREGGWYYALQGTVEEVRPGPEGTLISAVNGSGGRREVGSDYIIDCTGLEADIAEHRVLDDLLTHGGAGRNPLGRLDVERTFEVKGAANGDGAIYASGAATLGGDFPGSTRPRTAGGGPGDRRRSARRRWRNRIGPLRLTAEWVAGHWTPGRGSTEWSRS